MTQRSDNAARSCGNKRQYRTRSAARRAKRRMKRVTREQMDCYMCQFCGCYHLGHRP